MHDTYQELHEIRQHLVKKWECSFLVIAKQRVHHIRHFTQQIDILVILQKQPFRHCFTTEVGWNCESENHKQMTGETQTKKTKNNITVSTLPWRHMHFKTSQCHQLVIKILHVSSLVKWNSSNLKSFKNNLYKIITYLYLLWFDMNSYSNAFLKITKWFLFTSFSRFSSTTSS